MGTYSIYEEDIATVTNAYHNFKTQNGKYEDVLGFCKVATNDEIRDNDFVLTPGRYVGAAELEDDDEAFAEKMERLTAELNEQFIKNRELEVKIKENLNNISYE